MNKRSVPPAYESLAQVKANLAVLLDEMGVSPEQCKGLREKTMVIVSADDLRIVMEVGRQGQGPHVGARRRLRAALEHDA